MRILGFKIKTSAHLKKDLKKPALLVLNHLSYLDVLVLASQAPMCFVTSVEMKESLGLGWIVRLAGCLFVERRDKRSLHKEVLEITEALKHGFHVVVFPEATSTNGEELLRFRSPLFTAAVDAGVDVKTMALNYDHIDRSPITKRNRDIVCWYGDMTFAPHVLRLCKCREIHVAISEGARLKAPHKLTSKELALQSFNEVSKIFKPFKS